MLSYRTTEYAPTYLKENLSLPLYLTSFSCICPTHLCEETVQEVPKAKGSLLFFRCCFFFNLIHHVDRRIDRNSALESVSQPGNCLLRSRSNTADALADTQHEYSCTLQSMNLLCTLLCRYNLSNSNHCTMSTSWIAADCLKEPSLMRNLCRK